MPFSLHTKSDFLRRYVDGFEYLAGEVDKHASQLVKLKQTIIEQIDLFDKQWNRVIGIFIAVYVPLAFTTVCISS